MAHLPRHAFVPSRCCRLAYKDRIIRTGRTNVTNPSCVAHMIEALELQGDERVLEIGTGSGYQTAILAQLAARVCTVDRHADLVAASARRLAALGITNVESLTGDGWKGCPSESPFDAILVSAAPNEPPPELLKQLDPRRGRMLIPVGEPGRRQTLFLIRRAGDTTTRKPIGHCCFVPLVPFSGVD